MKRYKIIITIIFCLLIFILNSKHLLNDKIYHDRHLFLAEQVYNGNGYNYTKDYSATYPIWGYSALLYFGLLLGSPELFVLSLQFILCIIGLFLLYKIFETKFKYWHLILFLPYIAIMSVKLPDSIITFLIILFVYYIKLYYLQPNNIHTILAGIVLGIICNFRSEYIFLSLCFIPIVLKYYNYYFFRYIIKEICFLAFIIFVITVILLFPWYAKTGQLTSTNAGHVFYMALGQLPDNQMKIQHKDEFVNNLCEKEFKVDSYSVEGNKKLTKLFLKKICQYPNEYARKILYNLHRSLFLGVYTGEYYNFVIDREIVDKYKQDKKTIGYWQALKKLNIWQGILIFISRMIIIIYPVIFFIGLIKMFKKNKSKIMIDHLVYLAIIGIVVYKFIIVCLGQYEPRHMNTIYLLLIGFIIKK